MSALKENQEFWVQSFSEVFCFSIDWMVNGINVDGFLHRDYWCVNLALSKKLWFHHIISHACTHARYTSGAKNKKPLKPIEHIHCHLISSSCKFVSFNKIHWGNHSQSFFNYAWIYLIRIMWFFSWILL